LFQADEHHSEENLQHLDGLVERASSEGRTQGIDIDKVVTVLRSTKMNQPTTHWVWIVIVIITSMVCGAVWPIWVKLFDKCSSRIRKHIIPSSTRLHECEIGLQVNLEEEVTRGQADITVENSTPLTGFVQHGVLTVGHA